MKSILLIGLGRFGIHMAQKLHELHHEVLAVDSNEERVNNVMDFVTNAQIGDSTNEAFIASLGVRNFDVCVVAISKVLWKPLRFSRKTALLSCLPALPVKCTPNSC